MEFIAGWVGGRSVDPVAVGRRYLKDKQWEINIYIFSKTFIVRIYIYCIGKLYNKYLWVCVCVWFG